VDGLDEWMGCVGGWMDRCVGVLGEYMDGWVDGWVNGLVNGWMSCVDG